MHTKLNPVSVFLVMFQLVAAPSLANDQDTLPSTGSPGSKQSDESQAARGTTYGDQQQKQPNEDSTSNMGRTPNKPSTSSNAEANSQPVTMTGEADSKKSTVEQKFESSNPTAAKASPASQLRPADEKALSVLKSLDQYAPNVRAEWRRWQRMQAQSQKSSIEQMTANIQSMQKKTGAKPEQVVVAGALLGEVYYLDYRNKDAEAMLRWAEQSYAKLTGRDPLILANIQADIAQLCLDDGRNAEAEKLLLKILPVLPTDNVAALKNQLASSMGFLPARYFGIADMIANVPSNELNQGGTLSPLSMAARLSSAQSIATANLASVHLALARIYFHQKKIPQALSEYSKYWKLGKINALNSLTPQKR